MEDAQPNEHRLSSKGRSAVPIIRTSRPVDRRIGGPVRTGSQTGSTSSAPRWQSKYTNIAVPSHNRPPHASGVGQALPRLPGNSSSTPAPRDRMLGPERPWKKRRVDDPAQNAQGNNARAFDRGGPAKQPGRQDTRSKLTITVPLPAECQNGAYRCTQRRRGWLKSKRKELEKTHGVTVLNHSFKGSDVLFDCRIVEGPQSVCASSSTPVAAVPPPVANRPLPSPATKNVNSEQTTPLFSHLNAPIGRHDDHPDIEVWYLVP